MTKTLLLWVVLVGLLALPLTAFAQEDYPDINGSYTITGSYLDGSEPYTGTGSYTGFGSVYVFDGEYSYGETMSEPVLLMGRTMISAYGGDSCSESAYVRDEDNGVLLGLWLDSTHGDSIGMEVLTPTAATQDIVGSYTIHGLYPNGLSYHGTVDIQRGENDLYTLTYNYPADAENPALTTQAVGLMQGHILGAALQLDPAGESCSLFVGQIGDDLSYAGIWYEDGLFGTETGLKE